MMAFIVRRILVLPVILIGLMTITFFLMHSIPGDPVRLYLGPDVTIRPEVVEALNKQWGFDKPLYVQYVRYVTNFFRGNLGKSIRTGQMVLRDLASRLPATMELALFSFSLVLLVGIPLGVLSAAFKDTVVDHASRLGSLLFLSTPNFWIGLLVIYIFFFHLRILPAPSGRLGILAPAPAHITGMYVVDSLLSGDMSTLFEALRHIIAPATVLALGSIGLIVRMLRASMLEILSLDYIRTAESKGLSRGRIFFTHALRNALIPTITILAVQIGLLLSGNVLIETVFTWPGIGLYFVESIQWLDYAPVIGTTVMIASAFVLANLLADILYAVIDPRIRYTS